MTKPPTTPHWGYCTDCEDPWDDTDLREIDGAFLCAYCYQERLDHPLGLGSIVTYAYDYRDVSGGNVTTSIPKEDDALVREKAYQARIAQLEAALRRWVKYEPVHRRVCDYCGILSLGGNGHWPDCDWDKARKVLGESDE